MSKVKLKIKGLPQYYQGLVDFGNKTIDINGHQYNTGELALDVPISGAVYGTLLNYQGSYAAFESSMRQEPYMEPPKAPVLYIKPQNTLRSSGAVIPLPEGFFNLMVGAALGIVIGKQATKVDEDEALGYVYGYTVVNDVCIPHESIYRPAVKEIARDGFCPAGPWVVERDSVKNPDELDIRLYINGELKQENNTRNLVRSVSKLISDVTSFMTLYAGDTLLVGVPEKAPLAKENDRVQIKIDGVGMLHNTIKREQDLLGGVLDEACTSRL
ncbi:fumarylacetoacetate hydrolase family protein [Virgibacillus oceani]|uniref:Fumarylacetoacetase-like C-terminal domain-containing protein n=1 Tax=Virgibacillus oceani TaxID=1479511 RepID=A0A917MAP7_9BACI|nr:fumarylacetoacetate hydrolase family protein [Virgibacillus oceani]GGG88253.1 hypothetical protein GCM10011398_37800 [Virgibacillus oceani]